MEVPLQAGSPDPDSKDTYRSVKPPDQCVISYNFEHANSLNFTHNLLIGIGLDDPVRKPHSSLTATQKQKLFSIIPHPKKVFRNEPASVSKAYNNTVLPKRYVPNHPKPRNHPNYSEHLSGEQREQISNERSSHVQQERSQLAEEGRPTAEKDTAQVAQFNSPYGTLGKKKIEKSSYSKNEKSEANLSPLTTPKGTISPKVPAASYSQQDLEEGDSALNMPAFGNNFNAAQLIREVSQDKESQSNLQQNGHVTNDVEEDPYSGQLRPMPENQSSLTKQKQPTSSLSIKPEQSSKQELPHSNVSIDPAPENRLDSKAHLLGVSSEATKQDPFSHKKQSNTHANLKAPQEQTKVRSKKQIQDQQLQELQQRIRREESAKFKKGYFRVSSNKQKQILPFQASIEPLFTSSKQPFAQNHTSNSLPKNVSMSTNNRISQLNSSKVDPRKAIEQVARSSGFNSNFNLNNSLANTKIRTANQDSISRNTQKDGTLTKASRFTSPTQNLTTQLKEKQNLKVNPSLKRQSNNLNAIVAPQKIKRATEDSTSKPKSIKTETVEKYKSVGNETAEDLTANNQIKGFKVPQKVVSAKMPKLSKAESHQELLQRPSGLEGRKSNQQIKKKGADEKQNQKVASHSSSSFSSPNNNNFNSIKKPNNITDRIVDDKSSANNRNPSNNKMPNNNKISPNNKIASNNKIAANSKSQNKLVKGADKQRYSEIGPNTNPKRNEADSAIGDKKVSNPRSKQRQPGTRANQSALVGEAQKQSDKGNIEKPLKSTIGRQSKDKDYKFKKWRDAELEEVERQRRQSKRRQQSNASRERESKRSESKKRPKRSQVIDLDAQEDDRFGLLSMRKSNSNSRVSKGLRQGKKVKESKRTNTQEPAQYQEQEGNLSQNLQSRSNYQQQEVEEESSESSSESEKQQAEQYKEDEGLMDDNQERISSIHSSKITEQDEEPTERQISQRNRQSLPPKENLQELLIATEESPSPNKLQDLPVDIQLQDSNVIEPVTHQQAQGGIESENKEDSHLLEENPCEGKQIIIEQKEQRLIKQNEKQEILVENSNEQAVITSPNCKDIIENDDSNQSVEKLAIQKVLPMNPSPETDIAVNPLQCQADLELEQNQSNKVRMGSPLANISNKQEDLFEYNIKEMSKFNETVNQTFNVTKYETFDRDLTEYTRAPILSFIYGPSKTFTDSFLPSTQRISLLDEGSLGEPVGEETVDQAINILLSIDHWIIQRIFEPFLSKAGEIGVWLHWHGHWQIVQVPGNNFRTVLRNAIAKLGTQKVLQCGLEDVLRLISGVRVAKLKSSKKRVLSELDYSLNKKHVLKAVTSKNSKWGERMFEVVKVETSKQGGNVLKLKERSEFFWVREEKFQQIFQHFLLICTRPSHFWTTTRIASKQSHKSVMCLGSEAAIHGSVTLYYPSEQRSSLCFYKELQSKVLKFMGKIEQKANQNGNLYFEFRMHGTYYLFLQTPTDCELAIESTSKLTIGDPEYIVSQTLKNDRCEYVEIEHSRNPNRPASKQVETLEKLREKFINMVSIK